MFLLKAAQTMITPDTPCPTLTAYPDHPKCGLSKSMGVLPCIQEGCTDMLSSTAY